MQASAEPIGRLDSPAQARAWVILARHTEFVIAGMGFLASTT
jgi:hypothetical protein